MLASFFTRTRTKGSSAVLPLTTASQNPQAEFPADGVTDKQPTANPEAYRLYLKGQLYWNQRTGLGLKTAIEHFEQALAKDSNFALAYSGLANSYSLLGAYKTLAPRGAFGKARRAALQAVACDEQLAEAHTSLALVTWLHDWDWAGAERAFRRAIQLNPHYETAPHWFGLYLAEMGRFDEAVAAEQRSLELDPKSLFIQADLGRVYYYARRYEEALRHYRRAVELAPNFPAFYAELSFVYEQLGRYDELLAALEKSDERNQTLRAVYFQHGLKGVWQIMLHRLERDDPAKAFTIASYHTRLGQPQQALDWLARAYEARDHQLAQIKVEPLFDGLRADPRFVELMRRMNFTP